MDIFRRKKFDEAMFAKNRTLAIRVGQYQSSDIKEASFDYGYIKGETYKPGGTCAGSAKIVFTSIITTFNKLDKVYPEIGLLVDGTYEWVKMGEYFINDIEIDRNRKTTKLDLMDGMFRLNREHVTDLTYPAEIRHVIKEICLKTGITLANENMDITSMNYRIESIPKEKKMTFRDVLSLATQMLGMSCFFNREGKLEIKELTDSGIVITADSYFMHGLTKSEVEYQIAGITCKKDKELLTVGMRTGRSLELDNLFMSQAILDNLYHKIKDIRYYPFNLNYQGHLLLNVGEWVTIKTNTGETFKSPVLSQSFTFKGGLRGRISADSKAGNDAQYSYAGTITKKIVQFDEFEAQIQNQIEEVDKGFDQKVAKIKKDFSDQVELAKAKTEEVKRQLSDTIDQRLNSFNSGPLQEVKRRAEEALRNAGASSLLAQEAKRIGLDSIAKLEEFKSQATSAQTALLGNLDALKRTIASDIRPKQAQVETEIAKQVEALIQTKNELTGVKSAQSTYEETTTRRLAELTNLANDKASKSEVVQTAEELRSRIASVQVGGINLLRNTASLLIGNRSKGYWMSASGGNGRAISVEVLDPPQKMIKNMIRVIENTNGGNKDLTQLVRLRIGEKYTISCYARVASDSPNENVNLLFRSWANDTDLNRKFQKSISHKNWQKYSFTFTADAIENSIQFGQSGAGIIEICAPKIESGTLATDYSENPEDIGDRVSAVESIFKQRADSLDAGVNRLTEGLRTKADISALNVTAENIRQSVKSLETDTQNKLNQKLSMAEFDVRASSIRQEIVNATKDKADKTLITAEAGKLREELASLSVGGRNLLKGSKGPFKPNRNPANFDNNTLYSQETSVYLVQNEKYRISAKSDGNFTSWHSPNNENDNVVLWLMDKAVSNYQIVSDAKTATTGTEFVWNRPTGIYHLRVNTYRKDLQKLKSVWEVKVEQGSFKTGWSPAPEDVDGLITEAKATFERTAQGLRTDLSAIQEYVNKDGQRQETLRRYTREESAKQATSVRELVTRDFVGKASYQEDVRGLERRFSEIATQTNNDIASKIAQYKQTVDGQFASITSQIAGKANQTDFQRVKETSQLYERILGNTNNSIADNVARMAMTNQLFQVEVSKASASGRNLFLNSLFKRDLRDKYSTYKLSDDNTQTKGQLSVSIDSENQFRGVNTLKIVSTFSGKADNQKITFSLGGNSRTGRVDELKNKSARFSFWAKSTVNNTNFQARAGYRNTVQGVSLTTDWQFYDVEFVRNENSNATSELILHVFSNATVWIAFPKVEIGTVATPFSEAPEDTDEAIRTVQSQLAGSWGVHNKNSVNEIIAGFNLAGRNAGIKAETIRLEGRTLLDELTAIQGYFKRLFVGDASVGTLNSDIIRANSITADKLVMDMAMARMFVSSDIFTDTLAAKEAFINKLRSVVVTATLLEGYKGRIGGFQIGTHEKDSSVYWITGQNQFSVGMSNGSGQWSQTALWVNWGNNWGYPGDYAWYVKNNGKMYCYNTAEFWNTPVIHGNLRVTGHIYYNNENSGKTGHWIHSSKYSNFEPSNNYLYLYYSGSGYDWIPMNKEISDRRYKHNIEASTVSGLDVINNLKTYSYRKQYDGRIEDISCGIMAQDVQVHAPEAFFENPDGAYSYNTFALVPYLIKAIQELNQKIEKLEKT